MARILVGDDLERELKNVPTPAVRLAAELAQAFGAELHLVHSYRVPELTVPADAMSLIEGPYVEAMQNSLQQEADAIRASKPDLRLVVEVERGAPVPVLLKDAQSHSCQLIVLGTHARHGVRRALLGSVAEEVMRRALVPVLTVNPHAGQFEGFHPKKILVPLHFSERLDPALETAASLARKFNASLLLLHVIEEWVYPVVQSASLLAGGVVLPLERDLKEIGNARYAQLQAVAENLHGISVTSRLIERAASVSSAIIDTASAENCDLIVMSHRRASRLEYALEGSVSRAVAREAQCPVLSMPLKAS